MQESLYFIPGKATSFLGSAPGNAKGAILRCRELTARELADLQPWESKALLSLRGLMAEDNPGLTLLLTSRTDYQQRSLRSDIACRVLIGRTALRQTLARLRGANRTALRKLLGPASFSWHDWQVWKVAFEGQHYYIRSSRESTQYELGGVSKATAMQPTGGKRNRRFLSMFAQMLSVISGW